MKRFASAALAAATLIAPLATPSIAAADQYGGGYDRDRDHNRDWNRDRDRDRDGRWDRNDNRRDNGRRDQRRHDRWEGRRHNGYTYNGRWYYGPPPASYGYYEPGYRQWRRGDRLPSYYRSHYRDADWRYYRLRQPPRGYHYVRDDRGDFLLVALATGLILGTIIGNNNY